MASGQSCSSLSMWNRSAATTRSAEARSSAVTRRRSTRLRGARRRPVGQWDCPIPRTRCRRCRPPRRDPVRRPFHGPPAPPSGNGRCCPNTQTRPLPWAATLRAPRMNTETNPTSGRISQTDGPSHVHHDVPPRGGLPAAPVFFVGFQVFDGRLVPCRSWWWTTTRPCVTRWPGP